MSAGWLYYHKYPPKRKCRTCGKRHYMKRGGSMSNGADVWFMYCPKPGMTGQVNGQVVTSDGYEA